MLLTIDAGNTNTVLGVHDGASLQAHWRLTTRREQTADEYGILVRNLFAASGFEPGQIEGVAIASVVPPLTPVLVDQSQMPSPAPSTAKARRASFSAKASSVNLRSWIS